MEGLGTLKSFRHAEPLPPPTTTPTAQKTTTHTEMEGLGTYFCSGVKDRGEHERPRVTVKLAFDRWVGRWGDGDSVVTWVGGL